MNPLFSCLLLLGMASANPILAQNTSLDFETRPTALYDWQVGTMANGFSGWSFTGGGAEISTAQSVSGDQSLKFTATAPAPLSHPLSNPGGLRFLDLNLRLPVAKTITPGTTPTWPVGEAQLVLDCLPAMVARSGSSPTAQLYLYGEISGVGAWNPVGPALELDDSGLNLKKWLRLTVRTDTSNQICDLWIDTRLTSINQPLAPNLSGSFLMRCNVGQIAYVDDFVSGDTNPLYVDSDRDGMPDLYEYENLLDASVNDRNDDKDNDLLTNITEYWLGTKANGTDSDGDGLPDEWEQTNGLNPLSAADKLLDLDLDGYTNFEEFNAGTNPTDPNANGGSVVYVKAGVTGAQMGTFAAPFTTVQAALDAVPAGGRVVLLGSGGNITGTGNRNLAVSKPVTIVGRQGANLVNPTSSGGYALYTTFPPSSGPLTVEDLNFSGFFSSNDGSAVYSDQVPVVLRRCRFQNCSASDDGGAVFVNGASLLAEDCVFENCVSYDKGGAIYTEYVASVSLLRCRFLNCHTLYGDGCAVYFRQSGGVMENSLVWNCSNYYGGKGAVVCAEGTTVAFRWCTLLANRATTAGPGGIYNGNPSGTITLDSCILMNNLSGYYKNQLNGTAWTANYCSIDSLVLPGTQNTTSVNFLLNTPIVNGAYANYYGNQTGSAPITDIDGSLRDNHPERGCYEFNDPDLDGMPSAWELKYGLNPASRADADMDLDQDGYTNLDEFLRNSDPSVAAYADTQSAIFVNPVTGLDTNTGNFGASVKSISKAISLLSASRTKVCLANGIYVSSLNRNISLAAGVSTSPVLIKSLNGADAVTIDLEGQGRLLTTANPTTLQNLTIRNGFITGSGGAVLFSASGGAYGHSIVSCRFVACKATQGGAVYATAGCSFTLCQFTGCEATQNGGALAGMGKFFLNANTFSYNAATLQGGACYLEAGTADLQVRQSVFYRNNASEGGALSLVNSTVIEGASSVYNTVDTCNFKENVARTPTTNAASHGGAVLITNSMTGFHACLFRNNSVGANGTGGASGGAIYFVSGNPKIFGSTFVANEAAKEGGALRINAGEPNIVNCALSENLAGTAGGAVSVKAATAPSPAPVTTIAYSTLVYNRSPLGASLYYESDTNFNNNLSWFNVHDSGAASLQTKSTAPATLTALGNNLSSVRAGNVSLKPVLAFDNYHLAGPLPPSSPSILATASPDYWTLLAEPTSGGAYFYNDIDAESRGIGSPAAMESGCDEWLDTDADGLPDWFENYIIRYSGKDSLSTMASITPSLKLWNSQWTLLQVFQYGGNPLVPDNAQIDTDRDGLTDPVENSLGTNRFERDSDDDFFDDLFEVTFFATTNISDGTHPFNATTAYIKKPDGTYKDADGDNVSDMDEYLHNTDPSKKDTDGDTINDDIEIGQGSDPNDPNDKDPRPEEDIWKLKLGIGDGDGSKSEEWDMAIVRLKDDGTRGHVVLRYQSGARGVYKETTEPEKIPGGFCYQAEIYHRGSDREIPDADYKWIVEKNDDEQKFAVLDNNKGVDSRSGREGVLGDHYLTGKNGWTVKEVTGEAKKPAWPVYIIPSEIVPDDNQAGRTGDIVPSNKADTTTTPAKRGDSHYVTPKKSIAAVAPFTGIEWNNIADSHVKFKAKGLNKVVMDKCGVTWDGGEEDGDAREKHKVTRATADHIELKLQAVTKYGSAAEEIAKMNVWVVWADFKPTTGILLNKIIDEPANYSIGTTNLPIAIKGKRLTCVFNAYLTPSPQAILDEATDIPDLLGPNVTPDLPGAHYLDPSKLLKNGVEKRWDLTQRHKVVITSSLPDKAGQIDHPWPSELITGDDDFKVFVNTSPYGNIDMRYQDSPSIYLGPHQGGIGDTHVRHLQFQDFARLQLGKAGEGKWFVISDPYLWEVKFGLKKRAMVVSDVESTSRSLLKGPIVDATPITEAILPNSTQIGQPPYGFDENGDGDKDDAIGIWDIDTSTSNAGASNSAP